MAAALVRRGFVLAPSKLFRAEDSISFADTPRGILRREKHLPVFGAALVGMRLDSRPPAWSGVQKVLGKFPPVGFFETDLR